MSKAPVNGGAGDPGQHGALLAALRQRAGGRVRVLLADVWDAFREIAPGHIGSAEARGRLAELLSVLAGDAAVALPAGRRQWDRSAEPHLPLWLRLGAARPAAAGPRVDHRAIAWPPELAFLAGWPSVPALDEAVLIKEFLARGRDREPVPLRERSIEIFGDEKRLDVLASSRLFGPGRLSLELLRCFEVVPPLTWERPSGPAPPRALVIENLHTYDSFRRWNRTRTRYAAVAYGHGNQFARTARDLPRIVADLGLEAVEYFGDLDPRGIEIPTMAAGFLVSRGVALVPARRWYSLLLGRLGELDRFPARRLPSRINRAVDLSWLPVDLQPRVAELFACGKRLPQELVGWEALSRE